MRRLARNQQVSGPLDFKEISVLKFNVSSCNTHILAFKTYLTKQVEHEILSNFRYYGKHYLPI